MQQVLEYKEMAEQWAKEAFAEARLSTYECEVEIEAIKGRRAELLTQPVGNVQEHRSIEILLERSDEEERGKLAALQVLKDEEAKALEAWREKRRDVQVLEALRDEAKAAWQRAADKKEQAEMDEIATMRKAA